MSLPLRPRLVLPVLERADGELQVGVDPERALVLSWAHGLRAALQHLDGQHTLAQAAGLAGADPNSVSWAVQRLSDEGLLVQREATPPRVRLLGAGVLAKLFATEFLAAGVGHLIVVDSDPALPGLYAQPMATGAESLRHQLRSFRPWISVGRHWSDPDDVTSQLTVVANDRVECDRAITDTLLRTDQPHLFVRPLPDGGIVGPLVVPGQTPCTRCLDLTRCADPAWPRVLAQLCRLRLEPPPAVAAWAVGQALVQSLAWLSGGHPETLGGTWELRTDQWATSLRRWPAHPSCGCAWPLGR